MQHLQTNINDTNVSNVVIEFSSIEMHIITSALAYYAQNAYKLTNNISHSQIALLKRKFLTIVPRSYSFY